MRCLAVVVLASCAVVDSSGPAPEMCNGQPCPVSGPTPVTPPDPSVFDELDAGAMTVDVSGSASVAVDLHACKYERLHMWLGLGSAWFLVHPRSNRYCEMWLGGETENPNYDGSPAQYCLFDRSGTLLIAPKGGGPILMQNMPWCVPL
ncbi:MAG TPA: hypothetical protein VIV11_12290 [Kofleriaceae bacterium]